MKQVTDDWNVAKLTSKGNLKFQHLTTSGGWPFIHLLQPWQYLLRTLSSQYGRKTKNKRTEDPTPTPPKSRLPLATSASSGHSDNQSWDMNSTVVTHSFRTFPAYKQQAPSNSKSLRTSWKPCWAAMASFAHQHKQGATCVFHLMLGKRRKKKQTRLTKSSCFVRGTEGGEHNDQT